MLVKLCANVYHACSVSLSKKKKKKKTGDMFCLREMLKKQTAQEMIRETEEWTAERPSSCGQMFFPVKFCVLPGGKARMWRRLAVARRQG